MAVTTLRTSEEWYKLDNAWDIADPDGWSRRNPAIVCFWFRIPIPHEDYLGRLTRSSIVTFDRYGHVSPWAWGKREDAIWEEFQASVLGKTMINNGFRTQQMETNQEAWDECQRTALGSFLMAQGYIVPSAQSDQSISSPKCPSHGSSESSTTASNSSLGSTN